jgi:HNH endonuclease
MSDLPNSKLLEQLRSKCKEDRITGCWIYTLSANNSGYANTRRFGVSLGGESEMIQGSRLAWSAVHGTIPEGHEVDHLCRNKLCLNPFHLEAVTPTVNRQRNRIAEPQPLTAWWFPSPAITEVTFSSTMLPST